MADLSNIEAEVKRLHDRLGRLEHFRTGLVGERGDNGTVGRIREDLDSVKDRLESAESRLSRVENLHWKVMTLASIGGAVGGMLAKYLPF